jgi:hypothetical protein
MKSTGNISLATLIINKISSIKKSAHMTRIEDNRLSSYQRQVQAMMGNMDRREKHLKL